MWDPPRKEVLSYHPVLGRTTEKFRYYFYSLPVRQSVSVMTRNDFDPSTTSPLLVPTLGLQSKGLLSVQSRSPDSLRGSNRVVGFTSVTRDCRVSRHRGPSPGSGSRQVGPRDRTPDFSGHSPSMSPVRKGEMSTPLTPVLSPATKFLTVAKLPSLPYLVQSRVPKYLKVTSLRNPWVCSPEDQPSLRGLNKTSTGRGRIKTV